MSEPYPHRQGRQNSALEDFLGAASSRVPNVGPPPIAVVPAKPPQAAPVPRVEPEKQPTEPAVQAVKSAPPWLVSMVVHTVLILILALITTRPPDNAPLQFQAAYAEKAEPQLFDNLDSTASLLEKIETPALSLALNPINDPLAAPPVLADAFRLTHSIDAPQIGLALTGREAGMKKTLLLTYGGNATTEGAVLAGLEWLKRNQKSDGGWSLTGPYQDGGSIDNRVAATAMALLAFQGAGHTHAAGDFQREVQRGWNYLLKLQDADGFFKPPETGYQQLLYAQAQATIAICELYGMTKDEKYKRPAQLALQFAHKAQSREGGWRYQPRDDADLSVTGWFVMAFQSGRMAGLEVQSQMLDNVSKFLDRCATREDGGARYAYRPDEGSKPSMTAEGLLCRQYLGWKRDDERLRRGIEYILQNPIDYHEQNVYYWYYATQVCHHMDGDEWNRWNQVMREIVPAAQIKTGPDRGSWPPYDDQWGSSGGRLFTTCLSIYMLEVYYRHLPIYGWRLQ